MPTPDRVAFTIGPITVHWYGIMIMLGVILASYIAYREAKRRHEDPDHVWQLFPWVLIAGIVGARLGYVVASLGDPRYQDILNVFKIWEGGLSIQGAVIGGALAVIIYSWRYGISFFKWGDIIVPGLALAQAVGRWGNYFNQEVFGGPTDLPWGINIDVDRQQAVAGQVFGPSVRFHPTFAYEMVWDLLNFALLMWLGRQRRFRLLQGDLLWVYLIFYSVGRFAIEELRVDSAIVGGFRTPQVVAILTVILAWVMLIYRHRPGSNASYSETNLPEDEEAAIIAERTRIETPARRVSRVRRITPTSTQEMQTAATSEASTEGQ
ncbi:MAG TPA: prolipoprotein diacylglyceryl transferase [Chloroflexia bacterium]|nr:prolipoprotein diacylglyceryl transferase [Chloroflexia bacterium]